MKPSHGFFKTLNLLMFFTGLTFATTWLPFLRGLMDGPTYQWGTTLFGYAFSGSGTGGDFYYVVVNALTGLLLLASFYWIRKRGIFYVLLIVWYGSMIANIFYEVFAGQGYLFHGDTLGVAVDLSYVIVPFMLFLGYLVVRVLRKDPGNPFQPAWTRKNNHWLLAILLPLPVQYFLLSTGEPHGLTDQIGVILALLQVVFISRPFKGYKILES